jgi:DNA-binding response OmpR family regulator
MAAYQALIADEKIPAPTRARALLRVGRCQRKLGRLEAAKKTLEELLKGYPEEAEALRLARSFLKAIETGRVENLMLPKLDGLSVLRWFRKRSQSLPVLILSTTGREEEKVDNHILHLRRKLEPDPENPRHILMRHGMGYELRD